MTSEGAIGVVAEAGSGGAAKKKMKLRKWSADVQFVVNYICTKMHTNFWNAIVFLKWQFVAEILTSGIICWVAVPKNP
jgi:hypothetical protein